ncbi:LAQU0S13e03004g1_1 [Lachancea quebecensis]|uniref:Ribosomal lysine N-methyltransferase 5 n=1 Tax=Lachancea quebecensis TaxID=1654605 RepID=A0A0P1KVI7_9SACH|nr:LAQU0S13e03004g1_1 [Lachancea quebecensis]
MAVKLRLLDEDGIYEHLFERYSLLQKHADELKQDLGIVSRSCGDLEVSFEPQPHSHVKEPFNFEISQSLSSLSSSRDNNNSTTGYVVWSTTPFFLQWLLYSRSGAIFGQGGTIEVEGDPFHSTYEMPAIFSSRVVDPADSPDARVTPQHIIVELGAGIAGILCVALANYVDKYVCTDQKALLNGLKRNIKHNIDELRLRNMESSTLDFEISRRTALKTELDVLALDWESFDLKSPNLHALLTPASLSTVCILSMDVVYNEYLIEPFLRTLKKLLQSYRASGHSPFAVLGIQLRDQDVVEIFLSTAVVQFELRVCAIVDPDIEKTRFGLYYITIQ